MHCKYPDRYCERIKHSVKEIIRVQRLSMEQKLRRDLNMGDNLKKLRLANNYSQEKLCVELQRRSCDIGRTTYSKYESGELNIKISVIIALKKLYNCSYDDFFEGLDETNTF